MSEWVKLEVRMPANQENILKSLQVVNKEISNNLKEIQQKLKIAEEVLSQIRTIFHTTREYSESIFEMHSKLNNSKFDFINFLNQCTKLTATVEVHSDSSAVESAPACSLDSSHVQPEHDHSQPSHDERQ